MSVFLLVLFDDSDVFFDAWIAEFVGIAGWVFDSQFICFSFAGLFLSLKDDISNSFDSLEDLSA